jgi:hypothetical protein
MKLRVTVSSILLLIMMALAGTALATPTIQIWIPSTDVQPFLLAHADIDNYFRLARNSTGGRDTNTLDIGFEIGVLPFQKIQMEIGFDYLVLAQNPNDQHPWSGNIKLATPENSMFDYSPALAVGIYNARPVAEILAQDAPHVYSGQNIVYGLVAKTLPALGAVPSLGRLSAGYYHGSERALVSSFDERVAKAANTGVLLSWDRTMKEISDKLWFGVDYMGGNNIDSSVNFGLSWSFTKKISLIVGYDLYTKRSLAGENTINTQLDIDFP